MTMANSATISVCRLCGNQGQLRESHIIPAFVARWIKDTSATGFLRGYHVPDRRAQDFPKVRLLCADCEQRFSVAEREFAESIFVPFHRDHRSRFPYNDWLLYFAVSLAWRCLATSNGEGLRDHPHHASAVDRAQDIWKEYLLGRTDSVGQYRFNLFFTPLGGRSDSKVPEGLAWYFSRGADMTTVYSKVRAATYAKLPGMFFWTSIVPPDPGGWKGTRITKKGKLRQGGQAIEENAAGQFVMERAELIYTRINNLSPQQRERIAETVRRNPARAARSLSFAAWLDDERLRRENMLKA